MECITIRRQISDFFLNDSLIPVGNFKEIYKTIDSLEPFEYKRGLSKGFLCHLCQKSLKFDKEIWKEIETNFSSDPFLWLLTGLTYTRLKNYQKSIELYLNFLQFYQGFCLNSFILLKLMKCLIKTRKFQELLRTVQIDTQDLRPDHKFLVLGFRAYSLEMLGEKEKAKECYLALVDSNSSSSFACKFWLDLESQSINLPELNSLIDLYEEASQVYKDLNLLKAFYFFKSKNYISAIELLSKISERNKNGFLCTTLMGICYFQVRNLRKSSIFFYISACSNRNSPEAWFNLAKIYYECDNSKAYDALKFVNGLDHGELPFLKEIHEDFVVVPFNFAKFCKFDESCMRKVEKVGRKRGKKPKDMAVKCLENDALLLWQLKENKRTKYVEDESS